MNIQCWFPLKLTGLIFLQSSGLSGVFSSTTFWSYQFFGILPSLWSSSHNYTRPPGRPQPYHTDLGWQGNVCFPAQCLFLIAFLSRSNRLLISWLQSPSAVTLEPKRKAVTASTVSPSICHEVMGTDTMVLVFLIFSFKLALSLSSFTLIKRLFSSSLLSAIRVVSSTYLRFLMFLLPILIPACNSSCQAFLTMRSVHSSNKQIDSRQPRHTPFSILNKSVVPNRVLTFASWPAYRFLKRQVRWSGVPISLRAFHSLLWSTQSKVLA